jgi:hypothetical protein
MARKELLILSALDWKSCAETGAGSRLFAESGSGSGSSYLKNKDLKS